MLKKIGIVGYGVIGSYLFQRVNEDKNLAVAFVHDVDEEKLTGLEPSLRLSSIEGARDRGADLIVEVAGLEWVHHSASRVLEFCDLLIATVAAFTKDGFQKKLDAVAQANRTRYYISHGAIIGLDGVKDGREIIDEVKITSDGYLFDKFNKEPCTRSILYEGPTRKACELFPKYVNIHASLALHGLGFDKTQSAVIADSQAHIMRHTIEVKGQGLDWRIDIKGKQLGSKTAAYSAESIFQTAKRICMQGYGMNLV